MATDQQPDPRQEAVTELLWPYLKKDPERADRRMTGYGTKTQQGLFMSVLRAAEPPPVTPAPKAPPARPALLLEMALDDLVRAIQQASPRDLETAAKVAREKGRDLSRRAAERPTWRELATLLKRASK